MAVDREMGATEAPERSVRGSILAATERLLQDVDLDALSVAQILAGAGVSRATFYFYFASKDDAFVTLLNTVFVSIVPRFEAIMADVERRRSPLLRQDIADWLAIDHPQRAVVRNAVEEWPRRSELRAAYLTGHARLVDALEQAIDADREAGVALASVPSPQLAAGWIWTMERAWYWGVGGAGHLDDVPAVNVALAATLVAAIYGS